MKKKKTKLQIAREQAEEALNRTNLKIDELGKHTSSLYDALNGIQQLFDTIRNVPNEQRLQYENLKEIRLNWKQQVEKIDSDYKAAVAKNAGAGAAGIGAGVAVAALGPTAAMGIATTFGVASTGTAISTLSGAAATNAALAWLGGGALAAGGGGMAAGNAFLALAGPVGWAIAGVALLFSGVMLWKAKDDQKHIENIFTLISNRDVKSYDLAIVELNERIARIENESGLLKDAIENIKTFGVDYSLMTEAQQYELGAYVNLMESSMQLLVDPILGLQPKFSEQDYDNYVSSASDDTKRNAILDERDLIISFANLFYSIPMDEKDTKLIHKCFKKNKKFLQSIERKKKEFNIEIIEMAKEALQKQSKRKVPNEAN